MTLLNLGFRWRVLLPVAMALAMSVGGFYLYVNSNLITTYERNRQTVLESNRRLIDRLIEGSRTSFAQGRHLITYALDQLQNRSVGQQHLEQNLEQNLGRVWSDLHEWFEMDEMYIYGAEHQPLAVLGTTVREGGQALPTAAMFEEVRTGSPSREYVRCAQECTLYTLSSIRPGDARAGQMYVLLGVKLFRLVDRFVLFSSGELALLTTVSATGQAQTSTKPVLANLGVRLEYASEFYGSLILLQHIQASTDGKWLEKADLSEVAEHAWETRFLPTEFDNLFLALMEDVTTPLNALHSARQFAFIYLLSAYLGLLVLIFLLFKKPLDQLRRIGHAIPLLGSSEFSRLRYLVGLPDTDNLQGDEISLIHKTAFEVSFRLEQLESDLTANTAKLASTLQEVSSQHAFLKSLLDHSHILVLVLDADLRITLVNRFVCDYTSVALDSMPGKGLSEVFGESAGVKIAEKINTLGAQSVRHEFSFKDSSGQLCWINWIHCPLPGAYAEQDAHYLSIGIDVTQRKMAEQRIKDLAERDELTGLYNRRMFSIVIQDTLDRNTPAHLPVSLLFFDLDRFKLINDRFGHHFGDVYLKAVAEAILTHRSPHGTACRLGGDEFALILSGQSEAESVDIAEQVVAAINRIDLGELRHIEHTGASVGISLSPTHGTTIRELMSCADLAMYRAKHTQGRHIHVYSTDNKQALISKFDKRNYISQLINNNNLQIHVQPIVGVHDRRIFAFECLTRLSYREDELDISTEMLFRFANESGMAIDLDLHIMTRVIQDFAIFDAYCQHGGTVWDCVVDATSRLSVNISAHSLCDTMFRRRFLQLCDEHRVDLSRFLIEVTETVEIFDVSRAVEFIQEVKRRGALFAIDDFGDGFATLKYLRNLPFDVVKIDGQYIQNIDKSRKDQIITNSLIETARQFDVLVVVECVETEAVYEYFKSTSVDLVQGYLLAKPKPLSSLIIARLELVLEKSVPPKNKAGSRRPTPRLPA